MSLQSTLGNKDWLNSHEAALRELFPETWTHTANMRLLPLLFKLKVMGVDWRDEGDAPAILAFLQKSGVCILANNQVKRNHNPVTFDEVFKLDGSTLEQVMTADEEGEDDTSAATAAGIFAKLFLLFTWIGGFVLAKGFWSTLLCFFPFWAWYLVVERFFVIVGMVTPQ